MPDSCKLCGKSTLDTDESHVLCKHHKGLVHHSCCSNECSTHGEPCEHSLGIFNPKN
jgi:hypothetical protein